MFQKLLHRIDLLLHRNRFYRELADEMQSHLARRAADPMEALRHE